MKAIKVLILFVVLFGLIASVMIFFKTRISLPETAYFGYPHLEYLSNRIRELKGDTYSQVEVTNKAMEESFLSQLAALQRFRVEEYITKEQYQEQLDSFIVAYSNNFITIANNMFHTNSWPENSRLFIKHRVEELNKIKDLESNKPCLAGHILLGDEVNELLYTVMDYENGERLLNNKLFTSLEEASSLIDSCNIILSNRRINSCSRLLSALRSYPSEIGESHYSKLMDAFNILHNWKNANSLEEVMTSYDVFNSLADDYRQAKTLDLYKRYRDISEMETAAVACRSEAIDQLCYLYVDDSSDFINSTWDMSGGKQTYNVKTNHPNGYEITSLSSWFFCSSKSNNQFTINYQPNNTERTDWFLVKTGNKEVKINIKQTSSASIGKIISFETEHNVFEGNKKGMNIKVYYEVSNARNKTIQIACYFYDRYGNALKDKNQNYRTKNGDVAVHKNVTMTTDSSYSLITIFMPYDELHVSGRNVLLKYNVTMWEGTKAIAHSSTKTMEFSSY